MADAVEQDRLELVADRVLVEQASLLRAQFAVVRADCSDAPAVPAARSRSAH